MDAGKEGVGGGFFAFCGDVVGQGDFYALVYYGHDVGAVAFGFADDYSAVFGDVGQVEAMDFTNAQPHVGHEGEDGAVAVGGEVAPYEFYLFVCGAFLDGFIGGKVLMMRCMPLVRVPLYLRAVLRMRRLFFLVTSEWEDWSR